MKKSRLLSLMLALVMLFGVVSALGATASAADTVGARFVENLVLKTTRPGYYSVTGRPLIWNTGNVNLDSNYAKLELTGGNVNAFIVYSYGGSILPDGRGTMGFTIGAAKDLPAGYYEAELTLSYDRDGSGWKYDYEKLDTCSVWFSVSESASLYNVQIINGTSNGKTSVTGAYGHSFNIRADAPPSGKDFYKWEIVKGTVDIVYINDASSYALFADSDATIKATYKTQGTWLVSFDANGGSGTQADIEVKKGEKLTLPKCTFTPPEGEIFAGWNIGSGSEQPGASGAITKDTVIKATWKTAPRETITDAINVTVTAPKISASPDFNASLNSSKCELEKLDNTSNTLVYMIDGSSQMTSFNTFQSGHSYRAMVWINAKTTSEKMYVFPDNANAINVYINGKKATVERYSDTYIRAYYDFTLEPGGPNPTLTGYISLIATNMEVGNTVTVNLSGEVGNIPNSKLHYQWERDNGNGGYVNIPGATGRTYTIQSSDSDRFLRLTITADGYEGSVTSYIVYIKPSTTPSYQKGDVNMDKTLDNADLILVARYVVNLYNFGSEAFKLGDMDDSGAIDNSDLIRLARLLVGLS